MEKGQKLKPIELRRYHQNLSKGKGKSDTIIDAKRIALLPGKRVSKTGKLYYEYRQNRSDTGFGDVPD